MYARISHIDSIGKLIVGSGTRKYKLSVVQREVPFSIYMRGPREWPQISISLFSSGKPVKIHNFLEIVDMIPHLGNTLEIVLLPHYSTNTFSDDTVRVRIMIMTTTIQKPVVNADLRIIENIGAPVDKTFNQLYATIEDYIKRLRLEKEKTTHLEKEVSVLHRLLEERDGKIKILTDDYKQVCMALTMQPSLIQNDEINDTLMNTTLFSL